MILSAPAIIISHEVIFIHNFPMWMRVQTTFLALTCHNHNHALKESFYLTSISVLVKTNRQCFVADTLSYASWVHIILTTVIANIVVDKRSDDAKPLLKCYIATHDAILDQSERAHLSTHLRNYTKNECQRTEIHQVHLKWLNLKFASSHLQFLLRTSLVFSQHQHFEVSPKMKRLRTAPKLNSTIAIERAFRDYGISKNRLLY